MVQQQGCNALRVPKMLDIDNIEYLWGWCRSGNPPYTVVLHCCISLETTPFFSFFFFVFSNILKLFCVGFASASIFMFLDNNTCTSAQPPVHGWRG